MKQITQNFLEAESPTLNGLVHSIPFLYLALLHQINLFEGANLTELQK